MKTQVPGPQHEAFRNDMIEVMRKHGGKLSAAEMLALAAHFVGQLIALQDQRTMTPDAALFLVQVNLEQGNAEAIRESLATLLKPQGRG